MSAISDIVLPKNFSVERITYGQPKQLENGGKSVYISYNEKQLLVQTPDMAAPFGVSMWPGERGGPDKYNIDLSFGGRETRPALQSFFSMLETISDRVVTDAMEFSQSWFKRRFPSRDVVEALYTPIIRYSKDRETGEINNQYPPNFKMSLPFRDGKFQFPVYDAKRNDIDLMDVINSETRGKGSRVSAIVQCSAVWLAGGKFGITWKVRQLRITEPARLRGYAFQTTDEDNFVEDDAETPPAASNPKKRNDPVSEEAQKLLASSDEEGDGEIGNNSDDLEIIPTRRSGKPAAH